MDRYGSGKAKTRKKTRRSTQEDAQEDTQEDARLTLLHRLPAATISIFADLPQPSDAITLTTSGEIMRGLLAFAGQSGLKWHTAYRISLRANEKHLALRLHQFNVGRLCKQGAAMVEWLKLGAISLLLSTLLTAAIFLPLVSASH